MKSTLLATSLLAALAVAKPPNKRYWITETDVFTVTETVTITGSGNNNWKRATVAYCPNEVPNYASACNDAAYSSACPCFGYTETLTTTVAPTTTTKTIWVKPTGGSGCTATTVTKTVGGDVTVTSTSTVVTATTVTKVVDGSLTWSATTVTVTDTETAPCSSTTSYTPPSSCNVDGPLATKLVNNFAILLEQTNVGGTYNQAVSDETLDVNFVDISDSINFMSLQVALGAVSFNSKGAFDGGQGSQPPVALDVLNIWPSCDSVTWRWRISSTTLPVTGISHFTVSDEGLITKNWVEFDNAAWLQSYGQNCSFGSQSGAPGPQVVTPPASKRATLTY